MLPKRLLSVGGNFTPVRPRRAYLPPPLRTASASISAVHVCPATGKVARDHPQREKACAMAPVTKLRACALAAIMGNDSGAKPGICRCPSFQRAASHCLAVGLVGAIPHRSSAAGHVPTWARAFSAARCCQIECFSSLSRISGVRIETLYAGFLAQLHESSIAQREPRLIEGVELLEDQQSHRLAEIQRRLADWAEQVAGIEFGNAGADLGEIGRGHHHRGLKAREVDA